MSVETSPSLGNPTVRKRRPPLTGRPTRHRSREVFDATTSKCSLSITAQAPKASKATRISYVGSIVHGGSGTTNSTIWYAT